MTDQVLISIENGVGRIRLNRPKAIHALTPEMCQAINDALLAWREDDSVVAVMLDHSEGRGFCAGGDIALIANSAKADCKEAEHFFFLEYRMNHLLFVYEKPIVAFIDGIVMGGGVGISLPARYRVATERTTFAMPETGIGLFPDVGGGWFLSRTPGQLGAYLGVTGDVIGAADAIHADLADVFVPGSELAALQEAIVGAADVREAIQSFASRFVPQAQALPGKLAQHRAAIDRHFAFDTVAEIMDSLAADDSEFAQATLATMRKRSPLMMCVTLSQIRRAAALDIGDCLRMERTMVRRCFENGEVIEGVRALAIDKDHSPKWNPPTLAEVAPAMVDRFFDSAWPAYAHPLRDLA